MRGKAKRLGCRTLAGAVIMHSLVLGCVAPGNQRPAGAPGITLQVAREVTRVAPRTFELAKVAPSGRPAVRVKLETVAQVGAAGGFGLWGGAGRSMALMVYGAAGALAYFPIGALVILASPLAIVEGAMYDANVKRISSTLVEFDLPARVQAELTDWLAAARPGAEENADVTVEVSIAGYGFMSAEGLTPAPDWLRSSPVCFTLAAELSVRQGDRILFRDGVFEEPFRRSLDLPPTRCAGMIEWGEHDGQPAREALEEYTHVIAATIAKRLQVR